MSPIRAATPADGSAIDALALLATEGLKGRRGGDALAALWQGRIDTRHGLTEHLADCESAAFVLDGAVGLQGISLSWIDEGVGWLTVFVHPDARHEGHGPVLCAAALSWLDDHGVEHVDALALPGDRAMKSLFEKTGFKARLLTMRRSS